MKPDTLREIAGNCQALKDITRNAAIALSRQSECGHGYRIMGLLGAHQ